AGPAILCCFAPTLVHATSEPDRGWYAGPAVTTPGRCGVGPGARTSRSRRGRQRPARRAVTSGRGAIRIAGRRGPADLIRRDRTTDRPGVCAAPWRQLITARHPGGNHPMYKLLF